MGLITPTWSPVAVEETGEITPKWSPVKVEETGEKRAILRTQKSYRIAVKGSEKHLFAKEACLVIDLVSGHVANNVFNLTPADDGLVIDLTLDQTPPPPKVGNRGSAFPPVVNLTGKVDKTNNKGSKLSSPDEIFSRQCHVTAYDRTNLDNRNVSFLTMN
jgi:hypothetical protein